MGTIQIQILDYSPTEEEARLHTLAVRRIHQLLQKEFPTLTVMYPPEVELVEPAEPLLAGVLMLTEAECARLEQALSPLIKRLSMRHKRPFI